MKIRIQTQSIREVCYTIQLKQAMAIMCAISNDHQH
jgi:hypothetical protein